MKANELMIGDWVNHLNKPQRIKGAVDFTFAKDFNPIPLTAEILEKNGFVKVNSQRYDFGEPDTHCYINVNPKKKRIHINGANGSNVNMYYIIFGFYVHNFQHALRLCGLTELADNFKVE